MSAGRIKRSDDFGITAVNTDHIPGGVEPVESLGWLRQCGMEGRIGRIYIANKGRRRRQKITPLIKEKTALNIMQSDCSQRRATKSRAAWITPKAFHWNHFWHIIVWEFRSIDSDEGNCNNSWIATPRTTACRRMSMWFASGACSDSEWCVYCMDVSFRAFVLSWMRREEHRS